VPAFLNPLFLILLSSFLLGQVEEYGVGGVEGSSLPPQDRAAQLRRAKGFYLEAAAKGYRPTRMQHLAETVSLLSEDPKVVAAPGYHLLMKRFRDEVDGCFLTLLVSLPSA
jgi:hypothetical protein